MKWNDYDKMKPTETEKYLVIPLRSDMKIGHWYQVLEYNSEYDMWNSCDGSDEYAIEVKYWAELPDTETAGHGVEF